MATLSDKINLRGNIEERESVVLLLTPPKTNLVLDTHIPALVSFPYAISLSSVRMDLDVAPVGSSVVVNMYKNGNTMLDANKLTILSETTGGVGTLIDSVIASGDNISFSIDQIGATTPGQYLVVTINGVRV